MAEMITPNFSRAEMRCKCGTCKRDEMDPEFMKMLQELRNICGPLKVTSGYRCEQHNRDSGGYPKSAHVQGCAADIQIYGPRALKLMEESRKVGFRGIGFSQKGPHHQRFIHLDTLEREAVWSY